MWHLQRLCIYIGMCVYVGIVKILQACDYVGTSDLHYGYVASGTSCEGCYVCVHLLAGSELIARACTLSTFFFACDCVDTSDLAA